VKKVLLVFVLIFFTACEKEVENFNFPSEKIPTQILLRDKNYEPVGIAIPIYKNIFVAPNSIFKLDEDLFWRQEKAQILIKDFATDLIFFELKNNDLLPIKLSDLPPAVGQTFFSFVDGEVLESKILSVADEVDKFTVSGEMNKQKNLGTPIFDKNGRIYGIFISGNIEKSTLVFLRSDKILEFFKESF
jgi:hypothetical protein